MAARRRPFGGARRGGSKIATSWSYGTSVAFTTVPVGSKVLLSTFVLPPAALEVTIMRVRGRLWVVSDQSGSVEAFSGAFGMMIVNDLAIAAGAASILGPVTDGSDDVWFVHQTISGSGTQAILGDLSYEIDSKAMRKLPQGFGLAVMVENAFPGAPGGFDILFGLRVLTKVTQV